MKNAKKVIKEKKWSIIYSFKAERINESRLNHILPSPFIHFYANFLSGCFFISVNNLFQSVIFFFFFLSTSRYTIIPYMQLFTHCITLCVFYNFPQLWIFNTQKIENERKRQHKSQSVDFYHIFLVDVKLELGRLLWLSVCIFVKFSIRCKFLKDFEVKLFNLGYQKSQKIFFKKLVKNQTCSWRGGDGGCHIPQS